MRTCSTPGLLLSPKTWLRFGTPEALWFWLASAAGFRTTQITRWSRALDEGRQVAKHLTYDNVVGVCSGLQPAICTVVMHSLHPEDPADLLKERLFRMGLDGPWVDIILPTAIR